MDDSAGAKVRVEAILATDSGELVRAALTTFGVVAAIVAGGFAWLGRDGMLDPHSPDFFPLVHFCAVVGALLGVFFLVRSYIHGRRYGLFGTSVVEYAAPALGERLAGTLRIAKPEVLSAPVTLRLCCDWRHYKDRAGGTKSRSEVTSTLWEARIELPTAGAAIGMPFQFDLPEDGLPSGRRPKPRTGVHPEGGGTIIWMLKALSPRRGTDYYAEFEVVVKPSRAVARQARRDKAARLRSGGTGRGEAIPEGAGPVVQTLAILAGGRAADADEIRDDIEAQSRPEPDAPFASNPWQDTGRLSTIGRIALAVGLLLGAISIYSLGRQVMFTWKGVDMAATVTKVERGLVALDLGADDRNHRISVSAFHHWDPGQHVTARCMTAEDHARRCRMSTGADRWIEALVTTILAAAALAVWVAMRRRVGLAPAS